LPEQAPALIDMEEPLDLFQEPADEPLRQALPAGNFSGLELAEAPSSLDSAFSSSDQVPGLEIMRVIENSPAARARLEVGDLLLEAQLPGAEAIELRWPSQWRALELEQPPGTEVGLLLDRAGREATTVLRLEPRSSPAERQEAARYREEQRAGIVLRTATEVEARAAGLAPGAGAVLVGLARNSPWRGAGLRFGDLLSAVDGVTLDHPEALLERLRMAEDDAALNVTYLRPTGGAGGEPAFAPPQPAQVPVTQRKQVVRDFHLPLLLRYTRQGPGRSRWSALLGLLSYESTPAAWRVGYLWIGGFGGGDSERLEEVDG
jgi:C-terminal processing protease CtpA/Prc